MELSAWNIGRQQACSVSRSDLSVVGGKKTPGEKNILSKFGYMLLAITSFDNDTLSPYCVCFTVLIVQCIYLIPIDYEFIIRMRDKINMTTVMSDIRCAEEDTNIKHCHAKMMSQTCNRRNWDDVWLHCTSKMLHF